MPTELLIPDRYWVLTWTCYGNWLPGDERGLVGNVREFGHQLSHNIPGTPNDADLAGLETWCRMQMTGQPVVLDCNDAKAMIDQYQETARIKQWSLQAASVMFNHTHVVLGVPGDPEHNRGNLEKLGDSGSFKISVIAAKRYILGSEGLEAKAPR